MHSLLFVRIHICEGGEYKCWPPLQPHHSVMGMPRTKDPKGILWSLTSFSHSNLCMQV